MWVRVLREQLWEVAETGEEVDAKHVVDYVAPYGINFDQPPNKCPNFFKLLGLLTWDYLHAVHFPASRARFKKKIKCYLTKSMVI